MLIQKLSIAFGFLANELERVKVEVEWSFRSLDLKGGHDMGKYEGNYVIS